MLSVDHCVLIEVKRCEWIEIEQTEPVIFTTVIKALMTKHLLLITQQAPDQDPIDPTVAPSLLYNYQGRWFHRAWCTLRRGYLLFHLARISSTVLTEPCPIQTFHTDNLDESIDILKSAPRYRAVIHFTATAVIHQTPGMALESAHRSAGRWRYLTVTGGARPGADDESNAVRFPGPGPGAASPGGIHQR
jgi:predicted DNA-binding transcriptional regulator YafY